MFNSTLAKQSLIILTFPMFLTACGDLSDGDLNELKTQIINADQQKQDAVVDEPSKNLVPETGHPKDSLPVPNPYKNSQPSNTSKFLTLASGKKLSSIKVKGSSLRLATGSGRSFSNSKVSAYKKLKRETQSKPNHKVQWTFMNLDSGEVIERSLEADRKIFGASSSKIYVAAALLDLKDGAISSSQLQKMSDMLVVSSNTAWTSLQKEIGSGSSNKGRERIHRFTQRMGYEKTRGFQGYLGKIHGNELTPDESAQTLYDTYQNNFSGAETLWKIMHTCRTGSSRGRKYLPKSLYVGGKTGSYSGPTENPQTGETYNVRVKNHLMVFAVDGVQYALAILANSGTDDSAALLAGGLVREHTSIK